MLPFKLGLQLRVAASVLLSSACAISFPEGYQGETTMMGGGGENPTGQTSGRGGDGGTNSPGSSTSGTGGEQACTCDSSECGTCPVRTIVTVGVPYNFRIDATEVTNTQYGAFLEADLPPQPEPEADLPTEPDCSRNDTYVPSAGWTQQADSFPVVYVDWCDARAYCEWVGGRLCGSLNGGPGTHFDSNEGNLSEWWNACSGTNYQFAYGATAIEGNCNVDQSDEIAEVNSFESCHGVEPPYSEIFDMVGNAGEWTNEFISETPLIRGQWSGSPASVDDGCFSNWENADWDESRDNLGFRCCYSI